MKYQKAAQSTWRHSEGAPADKAVQTKEIIRYATLAPSGHNTQCWRFRREERFIAILPDLSRRTPVVDPVESVWFEKQPYEQHQCRRQEASSFGVILCK